MSSSRNSMCEALELNRNPLASVVARQERKKHGPAFAGPLDPGFRRDDVRAKPRPPSGRGPERHFASMNSNFAPDGSTAALTRSVSAGAPMNITRTPFIVPGWAWANEATARSADLAEFCEP